MIPFSNIPMFLSLKNDFLSREHHDLRQEFFLKHSLEHKFHVYYPILMNHDWDKYFSLWEYQSGEPGRNQGINIWYLPWRHDMPSFQMPCWVGAQTPSCSHPPLSQGSRWGGDTDSQVPWPGNASSCLMGEKNLEKSNCGSCRWREQETNLKFGLYP